MLDRMTNKMSGIFETPFTELHSSTFVDESIVEPLKKANVNVVQYRTDDCRGHALPLGRVLLYLRKDLLLWEVLSGQVDGSLRPLS